MTDPRFKLLKIEDEAFVGPLTSREALKRASEGATVLEGPKREAHIAIRGILGQSGLELKGVHVNEVGHYNDLSYKLLANAITMKDQGGFELTSVGLERLRQAWSKATKASFVQPILRPLMAIVKDRVDTARAEGRNLFDVTNDLRLTVEVKGLLPLGDINGYSQVSTLGTTRQKAEVSNDFYRGLRDVGGFLVEQIQGDAALPVIEGSLADGLSALKTYQDIDIQITDPELIALKRPESGDPYFPLVEEDRAKASFSLGLQKGTVIVDLQTGKKGRRGLIRSHGADYSSVVALQTEAKPGQTLLDPELIEEARLLGVEVADGGEVLHIPDHFRKGSKAIKYEDFPGDDLVFAVKVVEALCKLFPNLSDSESFMTEGDVELTSELNITYVVAKFVSKDGRDVTELGPLWDKLASKGTGSRSVDYFKVVGDAVHCTAKIHDVEDWGVVLTPFFTQMHQIAQSMGLEVHLSVAYEDALELLPVPDSGYVDYTGNAIVAAYRGASLKREGSWISLDRSFLSYAGLMTNEMSTYAAKGVPYQHVFWDIEDNGELKPHESKLVGVSHIEQSIVGFLDLDDPRKVFQLNPPHGFEGTGSGLSAMQRRAMKLAIDDCGYEPSRVAFIHGSKVDPRQIVANMLGVSIEDIGVALRRVIDPILIVKEGPTSIEQQEALDWLARQATAAQTPFKLIVDNTVDISDSFYSGEIATSQALRELTMPEAVAMIFEARADLDPATDTRILKQRIREWKNHKEGRWLVPRQILNALAVQLIKDGHQVLLPDSTDRKDWAGELARELETKKISQRGRTLVGIISLVGEALTVPELLEVYRDAYGEITEAELKFELEELSRAGERFFLVGVDGKFALGPKWDRKLGMKLARKGEFEVRKWAVGRNLNYTVVDSTLEVATREFEHRLKVREFCGSARTFDLVADLVEYYGKEKRNVVAAMTVIRRYLKAMDRFRQNLNPMPENKRLILRMAWIVMQVGTEDEKNLVYSYLDAMTGHADTLELDEGEKSEMYWRWGYSFNLNRKLPESLPVAPEHEALKTALEYCEGVAGDNRQVMHALTKTKGALAKWNRFKTARVAAQAGCGEDSVVAYGMEMAMGYQLGWALGRLKFIKRKLEDLPVEVAVVLQRYITELEMDARQLTEKESIAGVSTPIEFEINVNSWRLLAGIRRPFYGDEDEMLHNLFKWSIDGYEVMQFPVESEMFDTYNGWVNSRVFRVYGWLKNAEAGDAAMAVKIKDELESIQTDLDKLTDRLTQAANHGRLASAFLQRRNVLDLLYNYYKGFEPANSSAKVDTVDEYIALDQEMERFCGAVGADYQRDNSFYGAIEADDIDEPTEELETVEIPREVESAAK